MKILFIWNVAGVSSIMAKYMRKLGHDCMVVSRPYQDVFHYLDFYGDMKVEENFDEVVTNMSKDYDIILVSSLPYLAYEIKQKYPEKKVIVEYHGSDLRVGDARGIEKDKFVDKIFVSTPDLLQLRPNSTWIPNPVDIEHFKPGLHIDGAVFIKAPYHEYPKEVPFKFDIYDRSEKPLHYEDMPYFFSLYDTYVDIKYYKGFGYLPFHSKNALEALSTGMRVYSYKREFIKGLPEEHRPENVVKLLERTIQEIRG